MTRSATARLRLVFPVPPGPVSVRIRALSSSVGDLGDLRLPPEEARQPAGRLFGIASSDRRGGNSAASPSMTSCQTCSGCSRSFSRCSPRSRNPIAGREVATDEHVGRVGEEDLPAMRDAGDAAGTVDVEASVATRPRSSPSPVCMPMRTRICRAVRPRLLGQGALGVDRGRDGPGRRREGGEEGVALGADLDAAMGLDRGAHDLAVAGQERRATPRPARGREASSPRCR